MFVSGEMVSRDLGANWICSDLSTSAFLTVYSAPADLWLNWAINKLYVLSNIWIAVGVLLFWHSETNSDANFTIDTSLEKKSTPTVIELHYSPLHFQHCGAPESPQREAYFNLSSASPR